MCTIDGYMYTRAKQNGVLYKFDPKTGLTMQVATGLMSESDAYMAFSQKNPSKLYLAYTNSHCIYTYDVLTKKHELFAGIVNNSGYLDGIGSYAMFNQPRQLILDEDDNLYIADTENHVIRKVTPQGQVSTVIGQAGVAGYQDGDPEVALFDRPHGVCINKEGIIYQFIPNSNAWKVIIKNNTDETVWLNWKQAGFIVNGRASGISLYPFTTDEAPLETIKHNQEINRTITATNLITEKGISKIYHKKKFRKNGRTSVTIVFPMTVGNKPQFFHTFNFTVTKDN